MSPDHPMVRNAPLWADTESDCEFPAQPRQEPSGEERLVRAVIFLLSAAFVLSVAACAMPVIVSAVAKLF